MGKSTSMHASLLYSFPDLTTQLIEQLASLPHNRWCLQANSLELLDCEPAVHSPNPADPSKQRGKRVATAVCL